MFEKLLTPEFWQHNVDYVIFGILGFMSFLMLWKVLERYFFDMNVVLTMVGGNVVYKR